MSGAPFRETEGRFQWWQKEQIVQLKQEVLNSTALSLLNLTAERAGEWVKLDEICASAGRTEDQAKGDLSRLTKLIKERFGHDKWPVENKPLRPHGYRMPPHIAQYWKEA